MMSKDAASPTVRVAPAFRAEVESVLADGETLSQFVEAALRASVERRRAQADFIARGLRARDAARRSGDDHVDPDVAVAGLRKKLDAARKLAARKSQAKPA